ncbi:zinc ABC transporter substrate-binding protein [Ameyamaea chiangmaiensis]|nr:zinc ABC transporter substrate-binding protein [Ameyamaea chiangmaiensis]MBS4074927.1 zinc ABC transporter substrate-binding protein [Ameyamaea chiangmaiensis]
MRRISLSLFAVAAALSTTPVRAATTSPLTVVAAERVWADIADQVGGPDVTTRAILATPTVDPHMFEASPATVRALSEAAIVIATGDGYDPWMASLVAALPPGDRSVIDVAALPASRPADPLDPHLWFDPDRARAFATRLARTLDDRLGPDPRRSRRLEAFLTDLDTLSGRLAALRARTSGLSATATEPLANALLGAAGLRLRHLAFQKAIQNDTEPAPADVAAFEDDLRARAVVLMLNNAQIEAPTTRRLCALARASGVPVINVTETLPDGRHYQAWLNDVVDQIATVLPPAGASRP